METINNNLHFIKFLDFGGDLTNHDYINFNHTKKVMKKYFQDVVSEQLIHMLGVIDGLRILFLSQDFNEVRPLTKSLRERIFTLCEKKTIEE